MSASQQIQGMISGFDTTGIIEKLMEIERRGYEKTSEKVQVEKLRLQAYQSVNSMLSSLKTSVNSLAKQSLWNSKAATSTNETSLKATATSSAVEGSYSFRVGQLARTAQYLSKGFSSATKPVISPGSSKTNGTITLESSKAKVDTSVKLEELNGGKGVYRGSIRVTDASGSSTVIDVSACETIDQVIKSINSAAGVQVKASIKKNADGTSTGNQLELVDLSGGTGALRVQNVGEGTTATDLGIAGTSSLVNGEQVITGENIYHISNETALSSLRDGLGVEEGRMCITVKTASGEKDVYVDLNGQSKVGDVLSAVNNAIAEEAAKAGGEVWQGLQLAINDDKNGLTFTGAKAGCIYTVSNLWGQSEEGEMEMNQPQTVNQLGLIGTFAVAQDGDSFGGKRILGDMNSPLLTNLSGANKTGIGSETSRPKAPADKLESTTLLKDLNGGNGLDLTSALQFYFYEGSGDSWRPVTDLFDMDQIRLLATRDDATLGELVNYMNGCFSNSSVAGLKDVRINIDADAKGLYFTGLSSAHDYEMFGSLANSLGLSGSSFGSGQTIPEVEELYRVESIGPNGGADMILEGTKLNELTVNGVNITQAELDAMLVDGGLQLNIGGINVSVDLSQLTGDNTVEELYGTINAAIHEQVKAANPNANVPALTIDFTSQGLNWRNVDLGSDFQVSGTLADTLGIDKNYVGTAIPTVSTSVNKNLNPVVTGTSTPIDLSSGQLLSSLNGGKGLSLSGSTLSLAFGPEGSQSIVNVTRDELIAELGGNIGTATVNDYVNALNTLFTQKIGAHTDLNGTSASVTFGISTDGKGITITSAQGVNDGDTVQLGGDMATAASTGMGGLSAVGGTGFTEPEASDIRGVTVSTESVTGLGSIFLDIDGTQVELETTGIDQYSTLQDLIGVLNAELANKGYGDMSFGVSDSGSGLSFTNNSSKKAVIKYNDVHTLASDLGLVGTTSEKTDSTVAAKSHLNGNSVNRNYISRSTTLASLNGGNGADTGVLTVTNAQGTSVNIDMTGTLTIGDVIDAINGTLYGVNARINDAGDGIMIEQTVFEKPDGTPITGDISVTNADGNKMANHLGLSGTGKRDENGKSVLDGSMKTVIEVGPNDTLTDLRNRISELGVGYKTSIMNDGTGANAYRLSISAGSSGAGSDFIIDTDLDILGFQQVEKGQDSVLLYGTPDSGMSPVMLKSSTNTNNHALLGITLELGEVSEKYTTINVKTDTEAVVEEIKNMVQAYNDLSDMITYLDAYDVENETPGILFGDTTIRTLMDTIDEMFYQVYNPENLTYNDLVTSGKKGTWTWADLGIGFSTNNTASDGESGNYYSRMDLDLDALTDMVTNNWDTLYNMMASQRNVSDSTLAKGVAASSSFNFKYELDENGRPIKPDNESNPNNAINGDKSSSSFGTTNGFTANRPISEGENQYTVYFQGATTLDRVSIYHPNSAEYPSSDYALKDFTVEYLDAKTGKWELLREVNNNSGSSTILGVAANTSVMAVRVTAKSTNAEDGKFRLVDIQCLESNGLANKLNNTVNSLTDVVDGFFTRANEEVETKITDLQDQMEKMDERLTAKEESLWAKFTAMEKALSQLQSQGNYLSEMFASLNKK